jgi:hypothetical protein
VRIDVEMGTITSDFERVPETIPWRGGGAQDVGAVGATRFQAENILPARGSTRSQS